MVQHLNVIPYVPSAVSTLLARVTLLHGDDRITPQSIHRVQTVTDSAI